MVVGDAAGVVVTAVVFTVAKVLVAVAVQPDCVTVKL